MKRTFHPLIVFLPILLSVFLLLPSCSLRPEKPTVAELPVPESQEPESISEQEQTIGQTPIAEETPVIEEPTCIEQPPVLVGQLEASALTFDELDCEQLILVVSDGTAAQIYCYDCIDEQWTENSMISELSGFVGKNGTSDHHTEGDGTTPIGFYRLGFAFGNSENPGSSLEYRDVSSDDYWVSDPDSALYNMWVSGTDGFDIALAEHLCDYPNSYAYSVVIEYNMPDIVPYAGSAIFLHCGYEPTAGCVSVNENSMIDILRWLMPGAKILIV